MAIFDWVNQFGYSYTDGRRSLDALDDGLALEIPDDGGIVLELDRPDLLWELDGRWTEGLLAIASDYSRRSILEGKRFFTVLVMPPDAELIGRLIAQADVPAVWRGPF